MSDGMLGKGVYTLGEAARLTGVPVQRVRAWFKGWPGRRGPVLRAEFAGSGLPSNLISFLDLVEVRVVGGLRSRGVALPTVRRAYQTLAEHLNAAHPFSRSDLRTDGRDVFLHTAQETGDERLLDLARRQQAFASVLLPFLGRLDFDPPTRLARRWRIARGVVLDPAVRFGKPVVSACGIPASVIAAAYRANERDAGRVADWYGITVEDVQAAADFEARQTRRAA